ncbi:MAG: LPS-assembly protein LptD [Burkholderiales bacterium]|nr:LPS-assembly protein LptD [Burkholderiales bacterium]
MQRRASRLAVLLILLAGAAPAWPQAPRPSLVVPAPPREAAPAQAPRPAGPTTIDAETIEGVSELELTARGRVEFKREDLSIYSEYLRYSQEFGRLEAGGGVRLRHGIGRFTGARLRYSTRDDTGVIEDAKFLVDTHPPAHGGAEKIEILGKERLRLGNASYTTCRPEDRGWVIEAGELDLDFAAEEGTARDTRLRVADTTVLSLPYLSFPLENRRKTGFLAPYYTQNTRRGLEIGTPFYLNIAPEQDLTLTPVFMSKRGEQVKGTYNYLGESYRGKLHAEFLPRDEVLERPRSGYSFQHDQEFSPDLKLKVDMNKVSDDAYLVDFATNVRSISRGNLQREGLLSYTPTVLGLPSYVVVRAQKFQTLIDPLAPSANPYGRLPQISAGVVKTDLAGRFDLTLAGEYAKFTNNSMVEGGRSSFNPSISMPVVAPGYFFTPRAGLHYAHYNLENTALGQDRGQSVGVPWTSLDGGLVFERGLTLFGQSGRQTLEPRLFYVKAPYRKQSQAPLFDTTLADFNYTQLFSENRFVGGDRFGDASQLTAAASSRILDERGEERFRATLGQRYYFENERVALNAATPPPDKGRGDILASLGARFDAWSFDGTMQYDPRSPRVERLGATARYAPEIAKVLNVTYRYNADPANLIKQVDMSGQWPIAAGWYAVGRYNYSFLDGRIVEGLAGLEYNAGCWVFRAVAQRLQAATQTTSTGIFLQIELTGVGQIGSSDIADLLKRNVAGYARINPSDPSLVPQSLRPRLPFEQIF